MSMAWLRLRIGKHLRNTFEVGVYLCGINTLYIFMRSTLYIYGINTLPCGINTLPLWYQHLHTYVISTLLMFTILVPGDQAVQSHCPGSSPVQLHRLRPLSLHTRCL
uniref:Uncharacterized protein n=1 Tax=Cacopsylla melanoneura TaxID=428564 RepID=A0A8D9BE43_9HEMI